MADPITLDDFKRVELRIAKVVEAREHPNADKLLVLKVEVGAETKQICAGIRKYYKPEDLVGRSIVIVDNLQPAVLRGEESQGMLLAATDADGVVLLRPDRDMPSGCEVR
jgi:methionyl-tRNA synthetase